MARAARPHSFRPHRAPGALHQVQEFVNSHDRRTERDDLASAQALSAWLCERELLAAEEELAEEEWKSALEVREGLRMLLTAHQRGGQIDLEALASLNRAAATAEAPYRPFFASNDTVRLVCQSGGWPGALARLLGLVSEAMKLGRWRRLRACAEETCGRIFYDASNNRVGKWCNPRGCGNRVYTKAYRRRMKARERRS